MVNRSLRSNLYTLALVNTLRISTPGVAERNKALIVDSNKDLSGIRNLSVDNLNVSGTLLTATAAELNYTDTTPGLGEAGKALVLDDNRDIHNINALTANNLFGTLQTESQPHITNLGTLSNLNVNTNLNIIGHNGSTIGLRLNNTLVIATANDINKLSGLITNTSELNKISGLLINSTKLNYNDITTLGIAQESKTLVLDSNKDISGIHNLTATNLSGTIQTVDQPNITSLGTLVSLTANGNVNIASHNGLNTGLFLNNNLVTSTAAELNLLTNIQPGTVVANKVLAVDNNKDLLGLRNISINGNLNVNDIYLDNNLILSTADEINYLNGIIKGIASNNKALVIDNNKDLTGIRNLIIDNLTINGSNFQLPSGNIDSRPISPSLGFIRYNTETSQFEGYGAGNSWGSLGGVINVQQTTKILAENTPGSNDNNLRFINSNTETMRITSEGNIGINTNNPSYRLDISGTLRCTSSSIFQDTMTIYKTGSTNNSVSSGLIIRNNYSSASSYGLGIGIDFWNPDLTGGQSYSGSLNCIVTDPVTASFSNKFEFKLYNAGIINTVASIDSTGLLTTNYINISSHNGSTTGLQLNGTLVSSTAIELNYNDITTIGIAEASKTLVLNSSRNITNINNISVNNIALNNTTNYRTLIDCGLTTNDRIIGLYNDITSFYGIGAKDNLLKIQGGQSNGISFYTGASNISTGTEQMRISSTITNIINTLALNGISVTATATELNYNDITTIGIAEASKALILDSNKDITSIRNISATNLNGTIQTVSQPNITSLGTLTNLSTGDITLNGTLITATASELNALDGITANVTKLNYNDIATTGIAESSKALILDSNRDINNIRTLTATNLISTNLTGTIQTVSQPNITSLGTLTSLSTGNITLNGTLIIATASELNVLDGITANTTELNYNDIVSIGTAEASKALILDQSRNIININSLTATNLIGTIQTASQPNITSLGTLTSLSTGNITLNGTLITATATKLNYNDITAIGTAQASKSLILDSNKDIQSIRRLHLSNISIGTLDYTNLDRLITAVDNNLINGSAKYLCLGKAFSTYNEAEWGYFHVSDGSTSNRQEFGFYGANGIFAITAGRKVGINKTNPGYDLEVSGSINSTTLYLNGTLITSSAAELNYNDLTTIGTAEAGKALILDLSRNIININSLTANNLTGTIQTSTQPNITSLGILTSLSTGNITLNGILITATAADINKLTTMATTTTELNYLSGITPGSATASKALVLDINKDINNIRNLTTSRLLLGTSIDTTSSRLISALDSTITTGNTRRQITLGKAASANNQIEIAFNWISDDSSLNYMSLGLHSNSSIINILGNGNVGIATINPVYKLDINGSLNSTSFYLNGTQVTASAAELNYNVIATIGTAEASKSLILDLSRNISNINSLTATNLIGTLQTASQPNITSLGIITSLSTNALTLNGTLITATAADINKLTSMTTNTTELNYLSGITPGTSIASKALIVDINKDITSIRNLSATNLTGTLQTHSQPNITSVGTLLSLSTGNITLNGTLITSSADDINKLSNIIPGTVSASKVLIVDANKDISGISGLSITSNFTVINANAAFRLLPYTDNKIYLQAGLNNTNDSAADIFIGNYGVSANASSRKIIVKADGRVGLGTINPNYHLDVSGTINATSLYLNGIQITASAIELNYNDITTIGIAEANKALIVNSDRDITNLRNILATNLTGTLQTASQPNITSVGTLTSLSTGNITLNDILITSTATDINKLSNITEGIVSANKALIVDSNKDLTGLRNLTITGNLNVSGTTTTINSTQIMLQDNILQLNSGPSGSYDSGLIIQRYQTSNDNNLGEIINETNKESYTASSVSINTIVLPSGANANTNYYNGWWIKIQSATLGTNQVRQVLSYNGTSKTITISSNFTTTPTGTIIVNLYNKSFSNLVWQESNKRFITSFTAQDSTAGTLTILDYADLATNNLNILSTTDSTSSIAGGSLTIAGGAAIAKKLYIGSNLSVSGSSTMTGTLTVNNNATFGNISNASCTLTFNSANSNLRFYTHSDGICYIQAGSSLTAGSAADLFIGNYNNEVGASTRKFIIKADGKVGINTITPGYNLDINGSINSTSLYLNGIQITANAAELNYNDITTIGVAEASKALILDGSRNINNINSLSCTTLIVNGSAISASAAELNYLSGITIGTASASKALVVDTNKDIIGINSLTSTNLIITNLTLNDAAITSTASEINKLSGVTASTNQLNYVSGVNIGTALANKALVLDNSSNLNSGINNFSIGGILTVGTVGTNPNRINFKGLTGDNSDEYTVIAERHYSGTSDKTELILFKGNDANEFDGPDRIRLRSGEIRFQTYTSVESFSGLNDNNDRIVIKNDGKIGINTSIPIYQLDVSGDINTTGSLRVSGIAITATPAELNHLDFNTGSPGTAEASKALILDSNRDIANIRNLTATNLIGTIQTSNQPNITSLGTLTSLLTNSLTLNGTLITSSASELNKLDGLSASTAELNVLNGISASTAELNKLDGVTATTLEINTLAGITAGTVLANKSLIVDSNKMISGLNRIIFGTSGLNRTISNSNEYRILDGFNNTFTNNYTLTNTIDSSHGVSNYITQPTIAASNTNVTTTNFSTFYIHGEPINGTNMTITNKYALYINSGNSYLSGNVNIANHNGSTIGLRLNGTLVTATATELNKLSGLTTSTTELNKLTGLTASTNELNTLSGSTAGTASASKVLVLDLNRDIHNINSITATNLTGTIQTASQTLITTVGILTGLTSSGQVSITNNTASTNSTTGALIVTGGISSNGNINAGQIVKSGINNTSYNTIGTSGVYFQTGNATITNSGAAINSTVATSVFNSFARPTLAASNTGVTTTNASTVYIENEPLNGTNMALSNSYALWINSGKVLLGSGFGSSNKSTALLTINADTLRTNSEGSPHGLLICAGSTLVNTCLYMGADNTNSVSYIQSSKSGTLLPLVLNNRGGNVGIGLNSPGYKLDVSGDINLTGSLRFSGTAITATASDINKLTTVTTSAAELNYLSGITIGAALASKSLVLDNSRNINNINNISVNSIALGNSTDYRTLIDCGNVNGGVGLDRIISVINNGTGFTGFGAKDNLLKIQAGVSDGIAFYTGSNNTSVGIEQVRINNITTNIINTLALNGTSILATANEINKLNGLTSTTTELNKLNGLTSTTTELNKLSGLTSTTTELNKLSGLTSTTTELNKLSGLTSTSAELNYLSSISIGSATASKAIVLDINRNIINLNNIGSTSICLGTQTSNLSNRFISALDSTQSTASFKYITFGQSTTDRNSVDFGFLYNGISDNTNAFSIGFPTVGRRLVIQAGGNVGIGNISPSYALDISGDLNITGNYRINGSSINLTSITGITDGTGSANKALVLDNTNNLNSGINNFSIGGILTVGTVGSSNRINFKGTTGDATTNMSVIAERIYSGIEASELILFKGNDPLNGSGPDRIRLRASEIKFQTFTVVEDYSALNDNNDRLFIANDGKIGINTSSPSYQLDVSGDINLTGSLRFAGTSITASANEINKLAGVTALNSDINKLSSITEGIVSASKALIVDLNKDLTGLRNLTISGDLTVSGTTTTINSTQINLKDNILQLNSGPSGSYDSGLIIQRYQTSNDINNGDIVNETNKESYTASSITINTIVLPSGANANTNYYNGWWIKILSATTGANQVRQVLSYNGISKTITISSNFTTTPTGTIVVNLYNKTFSNLIWQESNKRFITGFTAQDATAGTITVLDYADLATNNLNILSTTDATSSIAGGSLTISGGTAIAKKLFVGSDLSVAGNTTITGTLTTGNITGTLASASSSQPNITSVGNLTIPASLTITNGSSPLNISNTTSSSSFICTIQNSGGAIDIGSSTNHDVHVKTNNTRRISISNTGNVNIAAHNGSSIGLQLNGTLVTATAIELNKLSGLTSSTTELNILTGVTATSSEINYLDLTSGIGIADANKAIVLNNDKDISGIRNITLATGGNLNTPNLLVSSTLRFTLSGGVNYIQSGSSSTSGTSADLFIGNMLQDSAGSTRKFMIKADGKVGIQNVSPVYNLDVNGSINSTSFYINATQVTATASELNYLDLPTGIGIADANKALVLNNDKDISGIRNLTVTNNIGIGTTSISSAPLHIYRTGAFTNGEAIIVESTTDQFVGYTLRGNNKTWQISKRTSGENNTLKFFHNDGTNWETSSLTMFPGGNISIGTDILNSYKLNVNGSINSTSLYINATQVTSSAAELNYLSSITLGTISASKVLTVDSSSNINSTLRLKKISNGQQIYFENGTSTGTIFHNLNGTLYFGSISANDIVFQTNNVNRVVITSAGLMNIQGGWQILGTTVTASATELNYLDFTSGGSPGTAEANKALIVNTDRDISNIRKITLNGEDDVITLSNTINTSRTAIKFIGDAKSWEFGTRNSSASNPNTFYLYDNSASLYRLLIDSDGDVNIVSHNGSSTGLQLGGTLVTSTATELNYLDLSSSIGVAEANKALVLNNDRDINNIRNLSVNNISLNNATTYPTALHCGSTASDRIIGVFNNTTTFYGFGAQGSLLKIQGGTSTGIAFYTNATNSSTGTEQMRISSTSTSILQTTTSTSSTTGALIVSGGIGCAGSVNIAGSLTVNNITTITGTLNVTSTANNTTSYGIYQTWSNPATTAVECDMYINNSNVQFGTSTNHPLRLMTNDTERMIITNAGNVGIGTTSPATKLAVQRSGIGNTSYIRWSDGTTIASTWINLAGVASLGTESTHGFGFYTDNGTSSQLYLEPSATKNVGIGTNTPSHKLQVNGTAKVTQLLVGTSTDTSSSRFMSALDSAMNVAGTTRYLAFGQDNSDGNQAEISFQWNGADSNNNKLFLGFHSASSILTLTNNNGYVGINVSSPSYNLEVKGAQSSAVIKGASDTFIAPSSWPSGWSGGLVTMDILCASVSYAGLSNRSDIRLKKDIFNYTRGLNELIQLRPVRYKWINEHIISDEEHYGFIAQELEQIIPEMVSESDNGYKNIKSEYTPLLVNSIKELNDRVVEQKNKITNLENENQQLKDQFNDILLRLQNLENNNL